MLIIQMRIRLCVCRSCNGLYSYAESMVRAQNDIFRYAYSNLSIVNAIDGVNTNIYSTFCFNIVTAITDSRLFFCPTDMSECCVSINTKDFMYTSSTCVCKHDRSRDICISLTNTHNAFIFQCPFLFASIVYH